MADWQHTHMQTATGKRSIITLLEKFSIVSSQSSLHISLKHKAASGLHSITMFSFFLNQLILKHSRHAKHYAEHKEEMFLTTFLKNALADDKCITAMGTQYKSTQPSIVHAKTECNMSEHIYSVSIRTALREDYCIIPTFHTSKRRQETTREL